MATDGQRLGSRAGSRWTLFLWGGAALLLSLPFFAMRFQAPGVDWSAADFIVMGTMLALVCGAIELAVRMTSDWSYRLAVATAIGGAFLIAWANLAVGIVGSERNAANVYFFYALLVGLVGVAIARLRPRGMALAMLATTGAIGLAFALAISGATDEPNVSHWRELAATFAISSPFPVSAWFFSNAVRR
jgi:hypothetical protein